MYVLISCSFRYLLLALEIETFSNILPHANDTVVEPGGSATDVNIESSARQEEQIVQLSKSQDSRTFSGIR
jgi:hypothetical protein